MASEDLPGERQKRMGSKSEVSVQTELEHGRLTARIVRAARRKCRKAQEVQESAGRDVWPVVAVATGYERNSATAIARGPS